MKNLIKCRNCGAEIKVSEVLTQQIEAEVSASSEAKHQEEIEEAVKKVETNFQKENDEQKERNKKLVGQISELLEEIKILRIKDEERDIEMKKKMLEEGERIKREERKKADDENQLINLQKDNKLNDALKQIEELKNKMQQGSQQAQGEVLEVELERLLKTEFPEDIISEVKKGERGADIIQEVIDKLGRKCGIILWESKNAKWDNNCSKKLKDDQRSKKAHLAVLVTVNKPDWLNSFTYKEGIWFSTLQFAIPLALALRFNLVSINHEKTLGEGKNEKKEILYQYFTGTDFKHRVEAIVEAFGTLQDDLERERKWFNTKWARQEKAIREVLDQTYGMYGDLQGIIGRSLPEIKTLELSEKTESALLLSDDNS